jgi:hypothetical protein
MMCSNAESARNFSALFLICKSSQVNETEMKNKWYLTWFLVFLTQVESLRLRRHCNLHDITIKCVYAVHSAGC